MKIDNYTFVIILCIGLILASLLPPPAAAVVLDICLYALVFKWVLPFARTSTIKPLHKWFIGMVICAAAAFIHPFLGLVVGAAGGATIWSVIKRN